MILCTCNDVCQEVDECKVVMLVVTTQMGGKSVNKLCQVKTMNNINKLCNSNQHYSKNVHAY